MKGITHADYMYANRICNDFEIKKLGKKQYIIVSRPIWELSKHVSWNVWTWPCSQASSYKKHQSKIRCFNSYWYVINDKKRYQRNNISHCLSICES